MLKVFAREMFLVYVLVLSALLMAVSGFEIASASVADHDITTCTELVAADDDTGTFADNFTLKNDIDCTGIDFAPLDWGGTSFAGTLDGGGFTISNLTINKPSDNKVGLVQKGDYATITSLVLVDSSVTGNNYVGVLAGQFDDGTITNVYSDATVNGNWNVGGFFGDADDTLIQYSATTGSVTGTDDNVGGFIGDGDSDDTIRDSYSLAAVHGIDDCGGLVGYTYYGLTTERVYYAGSVTCDSPSYYGGLVGEDDDGGFHAYDTFWDSLGGLNPATSEGNFEGATGLRTTAEMKDILNYTTGTPFDSYWDFDTIWDIDPELNDGYPFLRWSSDLFVVPEPEVVEDNDGVKASIEDNSPNDGDANNDGIKDSEQSTVTSLVSKTSNEYVVIESDVCSSNDSVLIENETEVEADDDDTFDYPAGLLDFSLSGCGVGGDVEIIQYYYGDFAVENVVLRKYDPSDDSYITIEDAVLSAVTVGGKKAIKAAYTVTDGGELDLDGIENGVIVDPVGLGQAVLADTGSETYSLPAIGVLILLITVQLAYATKEKLKES